MKRIILALACLAAIPTQTSALIITWGPDTDSDYLNITIDYSDGHWENIDDPARRAWVQNDGVDVVGSVNAGWNFVMGARWDVVGGLVIWAPEQYYMGFTYLTNPFYQVENGEFVVDLNIFEGAKAGQSGLWDGPIPVLTYTTPSVVNITWDLSGVSVPEAGSTVVMLAGALTALLAFSRSRAGSRARIAP
jgi:hypothetical protein